MIRRILIYASLVIVFFGAMHVLSKVQTETESSDSVVMEEVVLRRVQVLPITPQPFEQSILVPGVVEANADIALAVGIAGIVERVNVKEGDFVKAGQELFQIDLRSRMAMLEEARAAHALAEKTWKRTETLRKKGDVTIQEFDEAQSREIQAAAAVRRLEVEISLGHVYAPQNGIIDRVDVEEGEYLRDGVSMARLLALDPVKISVGIPEKFADAVAQQKTALVFIEALNEQRMGRIDRLAYGADERTKTFKATVILENKDYRIRPGMIVRAQIVVKKTQDALMVPLFSLVKNEAGMSLFVEKDGVVESRSVQMGGIDKEMVEIIDGLAEGDHVVIVGQKELVDQERVEVMPYSSLDSIPSVTEAVQ